MILFRTIAKFNFRSEFLEFALCSGNAPNLSVFDTYFWIRIIFCCIILQLPLFPCIKNNSPVSKKKTTFFSSHFYAFNYACDYQVLLCIFFLKNFNSGFFWNLDNCKRMKIQNFFLKKNNYPPYSFQNHETYVFWRKRQISLVIGFVHLHWYLLFLVLWYFDCLA